MRRITLQSSALVRCLTGHQAGNPATFIELFFATPDNFSGQQIFEGFA
jgi:hypothetical protein